MNRRVPMLVIVASLILLTAAYAEEADQQKAWFDLENCGMCKNFAAEAGLMDNLKWETHLIAEGSLSIAMVAPEYEEAFERAGKKMEATGMELMSGKQMPLCGFCTSYGALMQAGAKFESIHSAAGHITLVTSTDAEIVGLIQTHAKRTIAEYDKWIAEKGSGSASQK